MAAKISISAWSRLHLLDIVMQSSSRDRVQRHGKHTICYKLPGSGGVSKDIDLMPLGGYEG